MSTAILAIILNQLNGYTFPISMVLGSVGNLMIVIIFSRQRPNTCSMYLVASAIINNIYLIFRTFAQLFPFYYANETVHAFILCKLRVYIPVVLGLLTKAIIVLACADRFLITNNHANYRAFSRPKRAKYMILFSIIVWPIICSHVAIMTTIINGQCGQFGIYSIIYTIYIIIFVGLIPPIASGTLGYLTYHNFRQRHVRVHPIVHSMDASIRRRDRELFIILMSEVLVYVITAVPYPLVLLEMMISRYIISNKSVQYLEIESFIVGLAFILIFLSFATPFYIYLIFSKAFRRDCKQLLIHVYRRMRRQRVVPVDHRTAHHTFTQRGTHF